MRKKSDLKSALDAVAPVTSESHRNWSRPRDDWHGPTEHGRKCLAEIKRLLATPSPMTGKRWAYRVLERAAAGERIAPYAVQLAREAINETSRTPGEDDE